MDVDHACHVAHECVAPCPHRACVAEGHLVQVTHAQNQSRTITYRSPEGRWECRRGHDLSKPDAVMRRRNGDQLCRECNCERARRAKTTYESGRRIVQTNAQGEQIVVDDAARAQEIQRLDGIIASNCGSGG